MEGQRKRRSKGWEKEGERFAIFNFQENKKSKNNFFGCQRTAVFMLKCDVYLLEQFKSDSQQ